MPDEACTPIYALIDQFIEGNKILILKLLVIEVHKHLRDNLFQATPG
jgi:hypothetical protein